MKKVALLVLTLLVAVASFFGFIVAYHTYGRWLARKVFKLDPDAVTPAGRHLGGLQAGRPGPDHEKISVSHDHFPMQNSL